MTGTLLRNHWLDVCCDCRAYWGKLTDEDLIRIDGQFDRFVNALRARYGFSQIKAEEELERFLFRYSDGPLARPRTSLAMAEVQQ
jgi:uncharacterized protein YjbJ (UPF0337 family)